MYFPERLYENLPSFYFVISGGLVILGNGGLYIFSGIIFYCAACITLVARSARRRRDKRNLHSTKEVLPEVIYEYLPYGYIGLGILLIIIVDQEVIQFFAFTWCVYGLRNIMCRHANRNRQTIHF